MNAMGEPRPAGAITIRECAAVPAVDPPGKGKAKVGAPPPEVTDAEMLRLRADSDFARQLQAKLDAQEARGPAR